jgi:histidinol phosphatase-like PHP family hydrolase
MYCNIKKWILKIKMGVKMGVKNFKIDLHIHTPASRDFKGEKSENGYESILKEAKEAELDLICFTDHFSISGFRCFQEKKKKILETIDNLRSLDLFGQEHLEKDRKIKEDLYGCKSNNGS